MLQELPLEIVQAIIRRSQDDGDFKALKVLRCVSVSLRRQVDPFFFHTVIIRDLAQLYTRDTTRWRELETLRDLISDPHNSPSRYVKHIHFDILASTAKRRFSPLLTNVLAKLPDLECLLLDCHASCHQGSPCPILAVLPNLPKTSLKNLIWNHRDVDASSFEEFLNNQTALVRLDIPYFTGKLQLLPSAVPKLQMLHCHMETFTSLLLGWDLTHLKLLLPLVSVPVNLSGLDNIRVLSVTGDWEVVTRLVRTMPHLEYLGLSNRYCHKYARQWPAALPPFVKVIQPCRVRYIHIQLDIFDFARPPAQYLRELFNALPTLQTLEAPHPDDGRGNRMFYRWQRQELDLPVTFNTKNEWDWVEGWL
ncbi:hypothetical protein ONZ45_g11346 [Pleurotus djamor]|nr:hypothetical protein ONZ45_g11346 [Pleurotus djamor]